MEREHLGVRVALGEGVPEGAQPSALEVVGQKRALAVPGACDHGEERQVARLIQQGIEPLAPHGGAPHAWGQEFGTRDDLCAEQAASSCSSLTYPRLISLYPISQSESFFNAI
ncbi:hypothetical protein D3C87_1778440 [compost metagenome]